MGVVGSLVIPVFAGCSGDGGQRPDPVGQAAQAIDPLDVIPPTTFSVTLRVRPPAEPSWDQWAFPQTGPNFQTWHEYAYNYTPPVDENTLFAEYGYNVYWNVMGSLGVSVNGAQWNTETCLFGDLAKIAPNAVVTPCGATLPGGAPNQLSFGAQGDPLSRSFVVQTESDSVTFGVALDNIGQTSAQRAASGAEAAFGDGLSAFGGLLSAGDGIATLEAAGAAADATGYGAIVGAIIGVIGAIISIDADLNQAGHPAAQEACLGGIMDNPPQGSSTPRDAAQVQLTARQIYEGTRNGPLTVTLPSRLDFAPANGPLYFGTCRAATDVSLVIDRVTDSQKSAWTDGLAFQPRSADAAVVRRSDAIESFRVDPVHGVLLHDQWRYLNGGLTSCNGPLSCAPSPIVRTQQVSPGWNHPTLHNPATPLAALSPDAGHMAVFYVDDGGDLYMSEWIAAGSLDGGSWSTTKLTTGLPPNAHLAVLRADRSAAGGYDVFWIDQTGAVAVQNSLVLGFGPPDHVSPALGAAPGAPIAAVARTPLIGDVFVVAQGAVWQSDGPIGNLIQWTIDKPATRLAPSQGHVAPLSGLAAVATSANNLDVLYFDNARVLQRASWNTQSVVNGVNVWSIDGSLPQVQASGGAPLLISAVSRTPNHIDVALPCDATGVCGVSIDYANAFPNVPQGKAPVMPASGPPPTGSISIVAASSFSLDALTSGDGTCQFELSWQLGAQSWAHQRDACYPGSGINRSSDRDSLFDLNGDGSADVCGRGMAGVYCALSTGSRFHAPGATAGDSELWQASFSDQNQWIQPQYYQTIRYADVNGDGKADLCGRGVDGVFCALGNGGTAFGEARLWQSSFGDTAGWDQPQYYETIRYPDIDGDGRADVCGRAPDGIRCGRSTGSPVVGFGDASLWQGDFGDGAGWSQPQYYETIQYPDIDGDGKADLCARGIQGVFCYVSSGDHFWAVGAPLADFSDGAGWNQPKYYKTIAFPDVNGDGRADVCGRGTNGIFCALSNGAGFGDVTPWTPSFRDNESPEVYDGGPLHFADLDGDGKADVCGRGSAGIWCALSTGSAFDTTTLWQAAYGDAAGFGAPDKASSIHLPDLDGDGKADVCGRSADGVVCALSTGATFQAAHVWLADFNDLADWNLAPYGSTVAYPN